MASRFRAPFGASHVPTRWGDPFVDLQREVNRVFDDVFRGFGSRSDDETAMAAPRIDIDETDQEIHISAELPGVPMEAVDVSVDGDVLTIRGEKRCERKDERACVSERYYGSFQRAIQLPFEPDHDKVQANFENGVLKIALPKQDLSSKSHKIQVSTKEGGNGAKSVRSPTASGVEKA